MRSTSDRHRDWVRQVLDRAVDRNAFPLQERFLVHAFWVGPMVGLLTGSLLLGVSAFLWLVCVGAIWRRDEVPALAYCISYQWLFAAGGYAFFLTYGSIPGFPYPGDLEGAVLLSSLGFLTLAVGARLAWRRGAAILRRRSVRQPAVDERYDVVRLFWWVIAVYTVDWVMSIRPAGISFNSAQIIQNMMHFRAVLFLLLLLTVLRQRRGYGFALLASGFVLLPSFTSRMSGFSGVLILWLLAVFGEWRPWSADTFERMRSRRLAVGISVLGSVLLAAGIFWQGAVKYEWRNQHRLGAVQGSQAEKIGSFFDTAVDAASDFQLEKAFESLVERTSSGAIYFSHVLLRVPELIPHTGGTLTQRAVEHIMLPRFLFPGKPNLGADSWLVQRYAGLRVADERNNTSVGLGYIPEFYIDFGLAAMFLPLLVFGMLLGGISVACAYFSQSRLLASAAVTVILSSHFTAYDGEIAKILGGLVQKTIVFSAILYFAGPRLHAHLLTRARRFPSRVARSRSGWRVPPAETIPHGPVSPQRR